MLTLNYLIPCIGKIDISYNFANLVVGNFLIDVLLHLPLEEDFADTIRVMKIISISYFRNFSNSYFSLNPNSHIRE